MMFVYRRNIMAANDENENPNRDEGQPNPGFIAKGMLQNLAEFMAQQMNQANDLGYLRTQGYSFDQFNRQHLVCFHGKPASHLLRIGS